MLPTLYDGNLVFTVTVPRFMLKVGRIVVVKAETDLLIIKRIAKLSVYSSEFNTESRLEFQTSDSTSLILASDNHLSQSRYCDIPISSKRVLGLVLFTVPFT